jgi:hypothetical protein
MSSIHPLEKDDLPQVASLYERVMRSSSRTSGLGAHLGRMLLDHPWADPEEHLLHVLTRMQGTWWMGHLVEPFTSKAPSPR